MREQSPDCAPRGWTSDTFLSIIDNRCFVAQKATVRWNCFKPVTS